MAKNDDLSAWTQQSGSQQFPLNRHGKIDVVGRLEWIEGMWQMIQCAKRDNTKKSKDEDIREAKANLFNSK